MRIIAFSASLMIALLGFVGAGQAKTLSPIGSWSGGGTVKPHQGAPERTRCHATIRSAGSNRYNAYLSCATGGTKYSGSAIIRRTGGNNFSGSFNSSQFDIRGTVSARMTSRSRQTVSLRSNKGYGTLTLRRK